MCLEDIQIKLSIKFVGVELLARLRDTNVPWIILFIYLLNDKFTSIIFNISYDSRFRMKDKNYIYPQLKE